MIAYSNKKIKSKEDFSDESRKLEHDTGVG